MFRLSSKFFEKRCVFVVLVVIFFAIFSIISEAKEDFISYTNTKKIDACTCQILENYLFVQNTGNTISDYTLTTKGDAKDWLEIPLNEFRLAPGQKVGLKNFLKMPCSARGENSLITEIKTDLKKTKKVIQTIDVKNCPNIQIIPTINETATCPCTERYFPVSIFNSGNHIEEYKISLSPKINGVYLSNNFVALQPKTYTTIFVYAKPECGFFGNHSLELSALAKKSGIRGEVEFPLNIKKCYDFDLDIVDEYYVCKKTEKEIYFELENKADFPNRFNFELNGSSFLRFENDSIIIDKNEKEKIKLLVKGFDVPDDIYDFLLKIKTELGEEEKTKEFSVNLNNCYDVGLFLENVKENMIMGEKKSINVLINNTGKRDSMFYIDIDGPLWIKIDKPKQNKLLNLSKNEKKELKININPPYNLTGKYKAEIAIKDSTKKYILGSATLDVDIRKVEDAYRLSTLVENYVDINYSTTILPVSIRHKGNIQGTYNVFLSDIPWIKIDKNKITLAPDEEETLYMTLSPDNTVPINTYKLEFVLSEQTQKVKYGETIRVYLLNFPWYMKVLKNIEYFLIDYWLFVLVGVVVVIILLLIIIFAVKRMKRKKIKLKETDLAKKEEKIEKKKEIGISEVEYKKTEKKTEKKKKKREKRKWTWLWVLIIVIILVAIGAVGFVYFTSPGVVEEIGEIEEINKSTRISEQDGIEESTTIGQLEESEIDEKEGLVSIDRANIRGYGNKIYVETDEEIMLSMRINNPSNKELTLNTDLGDSVLVKLENESLIVPANSYVETNLVLTPNITELEENNIEIIIKLNLESDEFSRIEQVSLELQKGKPTRWLLWLIRIIIIIVIILVVVWVVRATAKKSQQKTLYDEYSEEIEDNVEKEKKEKPKIKRTNISLREK